MTARPIWTPEAIRALGVRTDVPTAGAILAGLCKDESYRAVKRGKFPVPVLKVGRHLVVPTQPILELLGLSTPAGGASPEAPPATATTPLLNGSHDEHTTSR
jgi:hypothetical protein